MKTYCLHCGQPIVWDHELYLHEESGVSMCSDGKGWAQEAPTKLLTPSELSAEFYRAALDLSQAHPDRKVGAARRLLTVQKFAHTPHHDQETTP